METIFKEGQKVVDKVFREGKKGTIRFISKNKFRNFILVDFKDSTPALYTFDGILFDIDGEFIDANPTLSIDNTAEENFNKIPTFEDIWNNKEKIYTSSYYDVNYLGYPSEELANAAEGLRKLLFFRDYYNDGWIANWKDKDEIKYYIEIFNDNFIIENCFMHNRVISFKTRQIAEKFLKEQIKLLEIAKPLL